MGRYRKLPVEIEAVQFTDETREAIIQWSGCGHNANLYFHKPGGKVLIAQPGDWIIRSVDGEFYVCEADIFAKTYEPIPSNTEGQ